jgi:hypothetical protein
LTIIEVEPIFIACCSFPTEKRSISVSYYEPFDVLSDEHRELLNDCRRKYLTANTQDPEGALPLCNKWQSHFETLIKGARTVAALEELQKLPAPTPKLARKLRIKLETERGTAARKLRRQNPSTDFVPGEALPA